MTSDRFDAVFFDFGGVVLTSPFEAFARYEQDHGLPDGFIRRLNTTNPHDNAWARLERGEIDINGFARLFEAEAVNQGQTINGRDVTGLLAGRVRPVMVEAITTIKEADLVTACLANNFLDQDRSGPRHGGRSDDEIRAVESVLTMFDHVVESSVIGIRKPEIDFYRRALALAEVEAERTVFLDDLGINLKPARALGMATIKVVDPIEALTRLEELLGLSLVR